MADNDQDNKTSVLGDIHQERRSSSNAEGKPFRDRGNVSANDEEFDPLAARKDSDPEWAKRSGSRDVSGGTGTVSGTRNMRSTGGATGMDIGNRPE